MKSKDQKTLEMLVNKYGIRGVLNEMADLVQIHIDENNPIQYDEKTVIQVDDLHSVKHNIEGDLF